MKRGLCAAAAVMILLGSAGCGGKKEVIKQDSVLANSANRYYARERFTQAIENYRTLTEEHPDSPFRRQGIMGLADSLYKDKQYFEAVLYYERFIELYPMDPLTSRARFYLAMSYYHDTTTPDRDQINTIKALDAFSLFLKNYPNHPLAPYARTLKADMELLRSESRLDIARFYHRIERSQAAIDRLNEFLKLFPGSSEAPEALFLLADSYYTEQSYKKAAKTLIKLIDEYPNSEYTDKAAEMAEKLKIKR